jgi:hypothetical protein
MIDLLLVEGKYELELAFSKLLASGRVLEPQSIAAHLNVVNLDLVDHDSGFVVQLLFLFPFDRSPDLQVLCEKHKYFGASKIVNLLGVDEGLALTRTTHDCLMSN